MSRLLVVHGTPLGPPAWARLEHAIHVPALRGLATVEPRADWSLGSFVDEIRPHLRRDGVVIGHDLGGVVAAMAALERPVRAIVLTGTALGAYWHLVRLTAAPLAWRYFYARHEGRRFLAGGVIGPEREAFVRAMEPELAAIPDLGARMRALALQMRPPRGLAAKLARNTPVHLIWGRRDPWYPPSVATGLARAAKARIHWVDAGHYAMWEAPRAFDAALDAVLAETR